jgi:hypothetical protein
VHGGSENLPNLGFDAPPVPLGPLLQALLDVFLELTDDDLGHGPSHMTDIMISVEYGQSNGSLSVFERIGRTS